MYVGQERTSMIIWIDGTLVPLDEARISPIDHGLTVGDGVFETLRIYDGVPFAWSRHLARLKASAAGLGLELPVVDTWREAATAVLAANDLRDARMRITVTGGPAAPGSSRRGGRAGGRRRRGPVDPQRTECDGRPQDDFLRRQRARPRLRRGTRGQ